MHKHERGKLRSNALKKSLVYLAGPITGASYDTATEWRSLISKMLPEFIQSVSPMRGKNHLSTETSIRAEYYGHVLSSSRGIMTRDYNDVQRCDALLVNLLGTKRVSIGTAMEVAWAYMARKPVVLVIEDCDNVHDHPMICEAAGFRVDNLEDAADVLASILGAGTD